MYITKEADYAVRIVSFLSTKKERTEAATIAKETAVSERFALKILRKLCENKIAVSFKGKNGGYMLAKPPEDISLRDVIETVDGKYMFNRCLSDDHDCSLEAIHCCRFRKVYADISDTISKRLEQCNFKDC